jgi:hypothetical protein
MKGEALAGRSQVAFLQSAKDLVVLAGDGRVIQDTAFIVNPRELGAPSKIRSYALCRKGFPHRAITRGGTS